MRHRLWSLASVFLCLCLTLGLCACAPAAQSPSASPSPTAAQPSPSQTAQDAGDAEDAEDVQGLMSSFAATDLDGQSVDQGIFSGYALTMVNVWATFCGPCIQEMPDLGELAAEYQDKGVRIVGLVSDVLDADGNLSKEQVETAREIVESTGANYLAPAAFGVSVRHPKPDQRRAHHLLRGRAGRAGGLRLYGLHVQGAVEPDPRRNAGGGCAMSFVRRNGTALALLLLGAALLAIGVGQGEAQVVFRKAVNLCMECIGLG